MLSSLLVLSSEIGLTRRRFSTEIRDPSAHRNHSWELLDGEAASLLDVEVSVSVVMNRECVNFVAD